MCEANASIDGEVDSVANLPTRLGEEGVEEEEALEVAHPTSRKLQQGEEGAEPELMRRIRRAKIRR